jgi:CSLREA domain-containing protein
MNKIIRFSVPFIISFLFLGMLIWLAGASSRVVAHSSRSTYEGSILVTTLDDELNDDGDCSLREAIQAANTNTPVDACSSGDVLTDTISFDVEGTIVVTSQLSVIAGGPLVIDGGDVITTSGGGTTRVWWVDTDSNLTLQHLAIVDGYSEGGSGIYNHGRSITINDCILSGNSTWNDGGGIYNENGSIAIINSTLSGNSTINNEIPGSYTCNGAAIYNATGIITVTNSILSGNNSDNNGGAIYTGDVYSGNGTMMIANSTISENYAFTTGGAIRNHGVLTITKSNLVGNSVSLFGGAIYNYNGTMIVSESNLSGNSASNEGGAIDNYYSTMTIINSTLSGNSSFSGGAIINNITLTVTNSTISENSTYNGGAINSDYGIIVATNTILDNNLTSDDCSGNIIDGGNNISSDDTCGFDPASNSLPNTDPLLGSLQDNGGPTFTHALSWNSPAIDAGNDAQCPATDQRGLVRPLDGDYDGVLVCDIGSYEREYQPVPPTLVTISGPGEARPGPVVSFTAMVEPISATLPITFTWHATDHPPITETRGLTDTVGWAWETTGTYAITVTASNLLGSVSDSHVITIKEIAPEYDIYLPLISRSGQPPLGSIPVFPLVGSGMFVVFIVGSLVRWKNK